MDRLRPYLDNGILELDNNAAERGLRAIAIGRQNYPFIGPEAGVIAAAIAHTLIETAKIIIAPQRGLTLRTMTNSAPNPVAQPAHLGKTETRNLAQVG